jgi:hypothetical protein
VSKNVCIKKQKFNWRKSQLFLHHLIDYEMQFRQEPEGKVRDLEGISGSNAEKNSKRREGSALHSVSMLRHATR